MEEHGAFVCTFLIYICLSTVVSFCLKMFCEDRPFVYFVERKCFALPVTISYQEFPCRLLHSQTCIFLTEFSPIRFWLGTFPPGISPVGSPAFMGSGVCAKAPVGTAPCVWPQPWEWRDSATQGLEPPAWPGVPRRVGREAVAPGEQEGIRGFVVPRGKALWGAGTGSECTGTFQHCQPGVTALLLREGSMGHPFHQVLCNEWCHFSSLTQLSVMFH